MTLNRDFYMKASIIHLNGGLMGDKCSMSSLKTVNFEHIHAQSTLLILSRLCGLLPRISTCFFPTSARWNKILLPDQYFSKLPNPTSILAHPAKRGTGHSYICFSRRYEKLSDHGAKCKHSLSYCFIQVRYSGFFQQIIIFSANLCPKSFFEKCRS